MSLFASQLGSVKAAHSSQFATGVVVTQAGTSSTTPAVIHNAKAETRTIDGTTQSVITRRCRFTDLATLRDDATVTIDGVDWSVDSVGPIPGGGVMATLIRFQATEPARNGYRR